MRNRWPETDLTAFDAALQERAASIRLALSRASAVDVQARWNVGAEVEKLKSAPRKYGKKVIPRLARLLGKGVSTVYKLAAVAKRWSEDAIRQILGRARDHHVDVTWSVVCAIAAVRPREAGNDLVEKLVTRAMTVRETRDLIAEKTRSKKSKGVRGSSSAAADRARRAIRHVQQLVEAGELAISSEHASATLSEALHVLDDVDSAQRPSNRATAAAPASGPSLKKRAAPVTARDASAS
jgi:hypothetical protein